MGLKGFIYTPDCTIFSNFFRGGPPNPHRREATPLPNPPQSALRASRNPPGWLLDPPLISWHGIKKTSRALEYDFRIRKMTRAASQAEDANSSRTPGLNSSVQTSMNDHRVRFYLCLNESASGISYFILAMKSCQERLNLNETQRRYFKYELQFKI